MTIHILFSILIMAPLFIFAQLPSEGKMDQIISTSLDFWKVPGCAVAVVQNNEAILTKGYGAKIDAHTVFPIASLTKLFTVVSLGMLVDRQALTWDSPIITSYPKLKLSDAYATTHLTFRDCLTMRSGLPGPSAERFLFSSPITAQELISEKLPKLPFDKGFRSHFAYQNLLYLLAVKPFSSWVDFLKKELLSPLSMHDTLTSFSQFQESKNKTALYQWKNDHFSETAPENLDAIVSAAGLYSSANDMSLFLSRIHTLISASTRTEIFTPQTTVAIEYFLDPESLFVKDILFPDCQFLDYGFGCFIHDYRGIKIIQVPGLTDGSTSVLALIPSLDLSICILTNGESAAFSHALLFQLIDAHLGTFTDWNRRFLQLIQNS